MAHTQTSIYLTDHDQVVLQELQTRYSMNRSEVIRLALHRLHASETGRSERLVELAEEIKALA